MKRKTKRQTKLQFWQRVHSTVSFRRLRVLLLFFVTLCAQLNSRNSGNSRLWRWFFVMTSLIEAVWRNGLAVLAGLFSKSKWPFQKYPTMISFESPPATNVSLVSDMKFSLLSWRSFRFFSSLLLWTVQCLFFLFCITWLTSVGLVVPV